MDGPEPFVPPIVKRAVRATRDFMRPMSGSLVAKRPAEEERLLLKPYCPKNPERSVNEIHYLT